MLHYADELVLDEEILVECDEYIPRLEIALSVGLRGPHSAKAPQPPTNADPTPPWPRLYE